MCNRVRKLVCRPIQTHRLKRFVESSTLIHPHHFDEFIYSDESTCFLSLFGWRLSQANRYGSNNAQYYRYEIVGEVPLSGCVGIVMTLYYIYTSQQCVSSEFTRICIDMWCIGIGADIICAQFMCLLMFPEREAIKFSLCPYAMLFFRYVRTLGL